MGVTSWHFLLNDDGVLRRVPRVTYERFHDLEAPLGVQITGPAKFINVMLQARTGHQ